MVIKVIGSSCPNCKKFFNLVQKVVKDLKIETDVEYIDDISKVIGLGVISSPALVVNEKVILSGSSHLEEEIREVIIKNEKVNCDPIGTTSSTCSCCGAN